MTLSPVTIEASADLLAQLVNPAVRALALGAAVGLALLAFRVRSTSTRLFTWTAVLYAALAMPLLAWMLPPLSVPLPEWAQRSAEMFNHPRPEQSRTHKSQTVPEAAKRVSEADVVALRAEIVKASAPGESKLHVFAGERAPESPAITIVTSAPADRPYQPAIPWVEVAGGVYVIVSGVLWARFFVGLLLARRLRRNSQSIVDPRVTQRLSALACASGMAFTPEAAESEAISVPVTTGALRSTILLPATWRDWDDSKLYAVIAHEMSHLIRGDALTQRISLLHRAIFWFSPLAWWLDRHLANLAEQASDEAALACGIDRREYARTLLGFFEALQTSPGRVWWQGVSMAKAGQAEQRVERILAWKGSVAMHIKKSIAIAVVTLAVPVVYLAASAQPSASLISSHGLRLAQVQVAPAAPSAPVAPKSAAAPKTSMVMSAGRASIAPKAPRNSYAYGYDDDNDERFVMVHGNNNTVTMSGSRHDAEMVDRLKKTIPGDFIWFERDGKPYIIRDQATIDRATSFWAPQEDLGKQQEELGAQQEVLGKQQEELSAKMEQVKVNVPDMTAELDRLKDKLKKLNSAATMEEIGDIQEAIGALQEKLGDVQSAAGEQQGKIGEEMGALGEKQGKLGEQQGKIGERQGEIARQAAHQMKQLLDESIKNGKAELRTEAGSL